MREVTLTKIVMPGQANTRGTLFGGVLLAMIDEAAAIAAVRYARCPVVTAHIGSVDFKAPVFQGEMAEVTARIVSVGRTSMHLQADAYGEDLITGGRRHCTTAKVVMVAMDPQGNPCPVPPLEVERG